MTSLSGILVLIFTVGLFIVLPLVIYLAAKDDKPKVTPEDQEAAEA